MLREQGTAGVVAPLLIDADGDYGKEAKEEKEGGGCRRGDLVK